MIILGIAACFLFCYWAYWTASSWKLDKLTETLPVPPGLPIIGHAMLFVGNTQKIHKNLEDIARLAFLHNRAVKLWMGPKLYIAIGNAVDAQVVLDNCLDKDVVYRFLRPWLGQGLFIATLGLWRIHRKVLLPVFSNRVVEQYLNIISDQANVLLERLTEQSGKGEFDILRYITACTLDIVFETAIGERMDVQHSPETPYLQARHKVMTILNKRLFKVWLQPDCLFNLTPYAKQQKDNIELTHKFTDEVVRNRRLHYETNKKTDQQPDARVKSVLDMLFGQEIDFTDEQLREHIDSITIAGNDTTSLVIAYTLVLLGIHQDAQDKVFVEQQSIFENSKRGATKEDLLCMNYLDRVIKESMRLYTVVPIIARKVDKEIYLHARVKSVLDMLFGQEIDFTDEQLREHIDSITIAGNDTTSLVIAYTLVLLGIHQDAQDKVFVEQQSIFENSKRGATKEDLLCMNYLDRVIKESMRLYTVVPIIARKVDKEIYLPHSKVMIPAGVGAVVGAFAVHRSVEEWGSDVNEFDPDRFLPERSINRHPAAFIPFSFGSRNCIGRNFGMMIIKSIISSIIRSFKIEANELGPLKVEVLLFPIRGHHVKITKRQ